MKTEKTPKQKQPATMVCDLRFRESPFFDRLKSALALIFKRRQVIEVTGCELRASTGTYSSIEIGYIGL